MRFLVFLLIALIHLSCKERKAKIEFDRTNISFNINKGDSLVSKFKFVNTGDDSLKIQSITSSCGCTSTDYKKTPVAPGDSGVLTVTYDTNIDSYSRGNISKTIIISANTTPILNKVYLTGVVNP